MPDKKQLLTEKAAELFNKEGFQSPSIDRIAAYAHIAKMTFYRYYPDKISLIQTILETRLEQFSAQLTALESQTDNPRDQLFSIFDFYAKWFASHDYHGCLFTRASQEYGQQYPQINTINQKFKQSLADLLTRVLIPKLKPEVAQRTAMMLLMLIDGAIVNSQVTTTYSEDYPPAATAWQAAKTLLYMQGYPLDAPIGEKS
ncbi:TetR/AcrR family transcriptional regulator [Celerinatantimonas sp. YJH-8]|uniref:TetR/AcrR family transcriptional regulator n=1 Tax=Celerinatantimonas sp. YJH-8 TaxID=3228714 RepID=UPI0038C7ABE0